MKQPAKRNLIFWIIWICCLAYVGTFSVLSKRPQSMHQWAQCDRASVARNYAEDDMNFFKPRVHETKMLTGITGMEFPLMNYAAAVCYKVFGFNEFWYRLLMLITVSLGVFYASKLSSQFIPSHFYALLITLVWYLSPIVVFYTPNFLADAAGLGFCMIGWWAFFTYQKEHKTKYLAIFTVLMLLACLVKISFMILVGVVIGLFVLDYLYFFNRTERKHYFKNKPKFFVALAVITIITSAWYYYSAWLSDKYEATYFLLDIKPEQSLSDLYDRVFNTFHFWNKSFYYGGVLFFVVLGILFLSYYYKRVNKVLLATTILYFIGNLCFYLLMSKQFHHHDYYFIHTYPFAFFLFIMILDVVYKVTRTERVYLRMLMPLIILFLFISELDYSRGRQHKRYDVNGSMNYQVFNPNWYDGMEEYVRELGITREDRVVTADDPSPNTSLYFLNLKGYSFSDGHSPEVVYQRVKDYKPGYLIANREDFLNRNSNLYEVAEFELLGEKNDIKVYKINYSE